MKRNTYSKQPITLSEKSKKVRNNEASSLEAEYKVGRKIEESVIAAGEISRLSIGIMVPASVSEEQIAGVSEMIRMVVGYDKERGDAISVGKLPVFDDAKDNSGNEEQKEVANPKIEKTAPSHVQIAHKPTQTASLNNIDWILKDTRVLLAIIGALLLILLVIILWPRNKNSGDKSSNLTAEEREQVLSEINGWLGVKQSGKGA